MDWPDEYDEDMDLLENSLMDELEEQQREDAGNEDEDLSC